MARPKKAGLDYYYRDVDEIDEYHRMMLMDKYGPTGCVVLDIIISRIYKNGYYLEMPVNVLSAQIQRVIGNKWVDSMESITGIIRYCGEIGLFDRELLARSVITSEAIQRNYSYVSARRKADRSKYWLLPEPDDTKKANPTEQTGISDAETGISAAIIPQSREEAEKTRENERIAEAEQTQSRADRHHPDCATEIYDDGAYDDGPAGNAAALPAALPANAGYERIDNAFYGATGRHLGKTDREHVDEIRNEGAEDSLILSVIGKVAARKGTKRINSFHYFLPIIRQSLEEQSSESDDEWGGYAYVENGFIHNKCEPYDPYADCTTTEEYLAALDRECSCTPARF